MTSGKNTNALVGMQSLVAASASFAFADVYISKLNIGAAATFWHAFTASIAMLVIFFATKRKFSKADAFALMPLGLFRVAVFSCVYIAYTYGKVGVVFTIVSCSALVAAGIFAPLYGEKFNPKIIGLLLVAIFGLVLVSRGNPSNFDFQFQTGEVFALLGMFGFAYSVVLVKKAAVKVEPVMNVTYMFIWLAVGSFPAFVVLDYFNLIEMRYWLSGREFIFLGIVLIGGIAGHLLLTAAQKNATMKMTSLSLPVGAVFTALLAIPVKQEFLDAWQWSGIAIIVCALSIAALIEKSVPIDEIHE